jgi:hypothetical protein
MKTTNQLTGGIPVQGSQELDAASSLEVLNSFIKDCRKAIRANRKMQVTVNADGKSSQLVFAGEGMTLSLIAS